MLAKPQRTPQSRNLHLVERSPPSSVTSQQVRVRSRSVSRPNSSSVKYGGGDEKEKEAYSRNQQFRAKLLELELEKQRDLRPLEKQMTAREREAFRRQQQDKAFQLEEKNATFTPKIVDDGFVKDVYERQARNLQAANKVAERLALKRHEGSGKTDEQLITSIKEDIKNGVPYESRHGYDYKVLRRAGLLDSSSSVNLSKTGYAAVSGVYDEAERKFK